MPTEKWWWKCDDAAGLDYVEEAVEGITTQWRTSNASGSKSTGGKVGTAWRLDDRYSSSRDYVTVNGTYSFSESELTVAFWIRYIGIGWTGNWAIIFDNNSFIDRGFSVDYDNGPFGGPFKVRFNVRTSAGNTSSVSTTSELSDSQYSSGDWHHIVCTYKDGVTKIYFDGTLENTNDTYQGDGGWGSGDGCTYNFLGNLSFDQEEIYLDDMRVIYTELGQEYVTFLYNDGNGTGVSVSEYGFIIYPNTEINVISPGTGIENNSAETRMVFR